MLGMIIEEATSSTYKAAVDHLISTVGLSSSTYLATANTLESPFAAGYENIGGTMTDVTLLNPSVLWAAGGMISNAPDIAKWGQYIWSGKLLNKTTMGEMNTYVNIGVGDVQYGLGIFKYQEGIYGHDGNFQGYNDQAIYIQPLDLTFVVCVNRMPNHATVISQKLAPVVFQYPPQEPPVPGAVRVGTALLFLLLLVVVVVGVITACYFI